MNDQRERYSPWGQAQASELAVMGAGLLLDHHPANSLWAQVEQAAGERIRPPKPSGSLACCQAQADLFRAAALRGALRHWPAKGDAPMDFVENYPLPTMACAPSTPRDAANLGGWAAAHNARLRRALRQGAGMPFHELARKTPVQVTTGNDFMWGQVFEAFDKADDLNSMLLWAEEGYAIRAELDAWQNTHGEALESILSRVKTSRDWSDSFAALLVGRLTSADWLRELSFHVQDSSRVTRFANGTSGRSAHGFGGLPRGRAITDIGLLPSPGTYTRTEYVPEPWSREQIAQYDAMPVLAWLYRPHPASFMDDNQQLLPAPSQVERLAAAIRAAVDAGLQGLAPARILFDTGSGAGQQEAKAVLVQAVNVALPACNLFDVNVGYDLRERLGDTGAASAFAGVGLASLAVWETGTTALVILAHRAQGATVLALAPPNKAYRNKFRRRPYEAA